MVSNSAHSSIENFHHVKQTTSVTEYIQRFEELMALNQMDYPGLIEQEMESNIT
jgi:hypothetical protein